MYDLMSGVLPGLAAGVMMQLLGPSGEPIFDAEGKEVGVIIRGRNSSQGLEAMRLNGNRRLEQARRTGSSTVTVEAGESELTEVLVACTVGWTFDQLNGEPFPYSPENARRFWSDDRFRRWRSQADDFFSNEANFTKG